MNEIDILDMFYDELRVEGKNRETLFISIDEAVVNKLQQKLKSNVSLEDVITLVDICIANEWLERTTADPNYNYLSLTLAGLEMAMSSHYAHENPK